MSMRMLRLWLQRSGSSRGVYVSLDELQRVVPGATRDALEAAQVDAVARVVGGGRDRQLGGLGGGSAVTSKACVVAPGAAGGRECRYWFLQCAVDSAGVDASHGDCGNMLAGVGSFALELGLAGPACAPVTRVRVLSMSTGARFDIDVPVAPDGSVQYAGDTPLAGVEQRGAPFRVSSLSPVGAISGRLWPAGGPLTQLQVPAPGLAVTCVDAVRQLVVAPATPLGVHLGAAGLAAAMDADAALHDRLEAIRLAAARAMGLGDCAGRAAPKLCLVGPGPAPGTLRAAYLVAPFLRETHPTIAMTAAQALAVAALSPGTVAAEALRGAPPAHPITSSGGSGSGSSSSSSSSSELELELRTVVPIYHPQGRVDISVDTASAPLADGGRVVRTGYVRTVTPLMRGETPLVAAAEASGASRQ